LDPDDLVSADPPELVVRNRSVAAAALQRVIGLLSQG
jgi:hypothetical protein